MPGQRILIILEDPKERRTYVDLFENHGFLVDALPNGDGVFNYLTEKKPDVVVADDATPEFSAIEFLQQVSADGLTCKTIIITPEPVVDYAVSLMKYGAMDYLIKPVDLRQLELSVRKSLMVNPVEKAGSVGPAGQDKKEFQNKKPVKIITQDPKMEQILALASRVADSSASVLIQGESGTGKELFARYLHEKSNRASQPFIAVNCAALPENLLESELFGHEKGAFTGAMSQKAGKFELANKGTLFLDEITEMQFHLQAKLLRVLQEKVVDRVGGTQPVDVDVRVIATTNRDAREAVDNQAFREDLFYRLNTIPLIIPPLRERFKDLTLLCEFFIKKYCKIDGRHVKGMTKEVHTLLMNHGFPGNVRELENIIHRAVLLAEFDEIRPQDLLMEGVEPVCDSPHTSGEIQAVDLASGSLKEMEQKMIFKTLDHTEGNRTHAAKILGISVRTLRNKLNEYKETL